MIRSLQFEGYLTDGKRTDPTGRIRILCRLEASIDSSDSDPDSEDDLLYEFDPRNSVLGLAKVFIPRATVVTVESLALQELAPMHKFQSNFPYVVMSCDPWSARAEVPRNVQMCMKF